MDAITTHKAGAAASDQHTASAIVFERIRKGLNVKVKDLAPVVGITDAGLFRAVREGRVPAVTIGRAVFITAKVAGPLVGIEPESTAA
ncbi:hypothetical protein [Methylobacterium sp. CM6247]